MTPENILIYHYVEEMISDYSSFFQKNLKNQDMTLKELSVLLKIKYIGDTTQHDLVEAFSVSSAYIAKLLRKFEDKGYVKRKEDPENRRRKLVELTDKGVKKTDEIIEVIKNWESEITSPLSDAELKAFKKTLFKITGGI